METKFKVGDKIRIKSTLRVVPRKAIGCEGVIIDDKGSMFSIIVKVNSFSEQYIAYASELELISKPLYRYMI